MSGAGSSGGAAAKLADGRSTRAEAARSARRAEIVAAASRVFSEHGYHATTVSRVIEAAGISRGTFYLYFDSKESLFLELLERFVLRIVEVVTIVDPGCEDPTAEILANVRRVVDVVFENRDLTVLVFRQNMGVNPEVDAKLLRLYGFLHEMVEGALVNGARSGLTREVDAPIVATALIGAMKELFYRYLVVEPVSEPDRQGMAHALLDFGLRGLLLDPA